MKHKPPKDAVGYKRPPKHTQFQKGTSGNPRGRPKGSLNQATLFRKALLQKITVTIEGRSRTMTKIEAVMLKLTNDALRGDPKAVQHVLALAHWVDAQPETEISATRETDQAVMNAILARTASTLRNQ